MDKSYLRYGHRVIMLIQRAKDGGHNRPDYHAHKLLVKDEGEYLSALANLRRVRDSKENPENWRIYANVNARNIEKAIRKFKFDMLEADYYDGFNRHRFYTDIENRWFGCVMVPSSRDETMFLIDVDYNHGEKYRDAKKILDEAGVEILFSYPTKNGRHIITEPYNPNLTPTLEVKKDALMFIE